MVLVLVVLFVVVGACEHVSVQQRAAGTQS